MTEQDKKRKNAIYRGLLNDYTFERNFMRICTSNCAWKENVNKWIGTFREMLSVMEDVPGFDEYMKRMHYKLFLLKDKCKLDNDAFYKEMILLFGYRLDDAENYKVNAFEYELNVKMQDKILLILEDENKKEKLVLFMVEHHPDLDDQMEITIPEEKEYDFYKNKYANKIDISNENVWLRLDFDNMTNILIYTEYFIINTKKDFILVPFISVSKHESTKRTLQS